MLRKLLTRVTLANNILNLSCKRIVISASASFLYRTPRLLCSSEKSGSTTKTTPMTLSSPRRLAITFTCKICNERLTRTFLKKSYDEGVVIIRCTSCLNNHIIADNLGWFSDLKGKKFVF